MKVDMSNAMVKDAVDGVVRELLRHTDDPGEMLVILGTTVSGIARETSDPVDTAMRMKDGIEKWIAVYQAEQREASS